MEITSYREEQTVVRRRIYRWTRLEDVYRELRVLSQEQHTGSVTLIFNQGGIRGMMTEQRTARARLKASA